MEHKAGRPSGYKFTRPINYNLLELVVVRLADLVHGTIHAQITLLDPHSTLANTLNLLHGVRNEQDRDVATLNKVLNTALAFLLEKDIANRKRLIDDENIGLGNRSDSKGDTRDHTRREVLQGHVNEVFKLGELNNLVKTSVDKLLGIAKQRTVQIEP